MSPGAIVSLMAYERYVAVCKPFDMETILSATKRKLFYSILTSYYLFCLFVLSVYSVATQVNISIWENEASIKIYI